MATANPAHHMKSPALKFALFISMLFVSFCTTGQAQAQTRNFQMALWTDESTPPVDADVGHFNQDDSQASKPVLSILEYFPFDAKINPATDPTTAWNNMVGRNNYDFSRILAVVVDEPYLNAVGFAPQGSPLWQNPCRDSGGSRYQNLAATYQRLQALAQAVKGTSPTTRFWINFSEPEVQWMMDTGCPANRPVTLNGSFVDVVSLDKYTKPFPGPCQVTLTQDAPCVQAYYDWLVSHRASSSQQLALVPGTFVQTQNGVIVPGTDGSSQATLLAGFFSYANSMNQSCTLPFGSTEATGNFDGCLVWAVAGFPGLNFLDSSTSPPTLWCGEFAGSSAKQNVACNNPGIVAPIHQAWTGGFGRRSRKNPARP